MNDLVQIEAKHLQWCNVGFGFYPENTITATRRFVTVPHHCAGNYVSFMGDDGHPENKSLVFVRKDDFEKQVIRKIKTMFSVEPDMVLKNSVGEIKVVYGYYHSDGNLEGVEIEIEADPRPWEKQYKIQ